MHCQPGGVSPDWRRALAHRSPDLLAEVAQRFQASGVSPDQVGRVLVDGGDALYEAATGGEPGWADRFGGPLAAALLAAEVSALAAHLNSRGSTVRALAVDRLLDEFSAITVAARLGVSRQKVYEISRGDHTGHFIERVPWRQP